MPYLDDVFREIREAEAAVGRRSRASARATALGPGGAALLNDISERYPHLSPDSLMALGRAGYGPDHPMTVQLATIEAGRHLRDFPLGRGTGAPSLTPGQRRLMNQRGEQAPSPDLPRMSPEARATMTPGQRRVMDAEPGGLDPHSANIVDAAKARGIIRDDGSIVRPTEARFEDGEWTYDSPFAEETDRLFHDIMSALAEQEGSDDPIPFVWGTGTSAEGEQGSYYPRTGNTDVATRDGEPIVDIPGPLDDWLRRGRQNVLTLAAERRIPDPLGAGQIAPTTAGPATPMTTIRYGFAGLEAPVQEIQGQVRNIYGATHGQNVDWWESQSDLGVMLSTGLDIEDAGEGFFVDPESAVAEARRSREEERGQIGGHNVTLGRWVADAANFDPNTRPALILSGMVDLGVQMADPSAFGLGKLGEARAARSLFAAADPVAEADAGVVRGLRTLVSPTDAQRWLNGPEGASRLDWLARTSSPGEVWQGMNRKVTFDLARQLADAPTPEDVRILLEPELGRSIREVSTVAMPTRNRFGVETSPARRMPSIMPSRGPIDAWDKDIVGRELERWMFNGGSSEESTRKILDQVARSEGTAGLNAAIRDAIRDVDGALAHQGIGPEMRKQLLALHEGGVEASRVIHEMVMTNQSPSFNAVAVGGEAVDLPPSMLFIEHAPRYLSLPDARDIRRVQSRFSRILANGESGKLRIGFAAMEAIQNELWKPVQLVTRIAWPIRVIGEEQIRLAAAGYDSMFRHPASLIALRLGRRGGNDVLGDPIEAANQLKATLTRTHGGWAERPMASPHRATMHRDSIREREAYLEGWGSEILRLYGDPVANRVHRSATLDEAKEWLHRGGGQAFKRDMAEMHPETFASEAMADRWLEEVVDPRLRWAHGGDTEISDAIRTGKFRGKDIFDGSKLDKDFLAYLGTRADDIGPETVIGDISNIRRRDTASRLHDALNKATDRMFTVLMSERTNNLSRVPAFKQEYWREAERLLPALDPQAKAAFMAAAEQANLDAGRLSNRTMKRLRSTEARGDLTLEDLDFLAKGQALDHTKELLYDLTRKGRTADAWRIVFPFGEAWSEVITRWFGRQGIVWQNPKTIRRFQQIMQGARGEDLGQLMGNPEGEGFFWENEFGEEVFIYPGSSLITEHTLGIPIPLTGRVQGLSMFGTVMPGLGPVAQIPTGWFLANKPWMPDDFADFLTDVENMEINVGGLELGTVHEQILPFGAIGTEDQSEIWSLDSYVPAWVRAALQAATVGDQSDEQWATTVMEVAGYLQTTGDYGDSPEERQRLYHNAAEKAKGLYFIKAAAGAVAPSSPDILAMVTNDRGDLLRLAALREEWQALIDPENGGDYRTAAQTFLDTYGEDITAVVTTAMTTSSRVGTPTKRDGVAWVREHPEVRAALRDTYGLFAPDTGADDFSLYEAELRTGERVRLNPRIWVDLLNNTKGDLLWSQAQAQVGGSPNRAQQQWLRDVADSIRDAYPSWGNEAGQLERPPVESMVAELERAVDLEALQGTDAVAGLRLYLDARERALDNAREAGVQHFNRAQSMEGTRVWLNDVAEAIMQEHPDFEPLWTFVFSREARTEE